jgi:Large ribosomal RNA subunit accumulation protein YceD
MSEHSLEKSAPVPWRVPVAVADIPEEGRHFALVADADTRASIARMAGLRDLLQLKADFDVTRQGGDGLRVVGHVSATVGQTCVVSLEPVTNEVEEDVDLLFVPKSTDELPAGETEKGESRVETKWDEPEALVGGAVDLGIVATEFLILGLDPYPRKPGVVFEPPQDLKPDGGPFASLAGWSRDRNER